MKIMLRYMILAVLSVLLTSFGNITYAQTVHKKEISGKGNHSHLLKDTLDRIAREDTKCILVEHKPVIEVTEDLIRRVDKIMDSKKSSTDERLKEVLYLFDCTTYGYQQKNSVASQKEVIRVLKNYTEEKDIPNVSFGEVRSSLYNIMKLIGDFVPQSKHLYVNSFLKTLAPYQRKQLSVGLTVSQMTKVQQASLLQFAWSFPFEGLTSISKVNWRIQNYLDKKTYYSMNEYFGVLYPQYAGPFGPNRAEWAVVLGEWLNTQSGGATSFSGVKGKIEIIAGKIETQETDYTEPKPDWQTVLQHITALNSRLATVNSSTSKSSESTRMVRIEVDEDIASKRLLIVGENNVEPLAVLHGIAEVYGLRIVRRSGNVLFLTVPLPKKLESPAGARGEILRLLPQPLLRYIQARIANDEQLKDNLFNPTYKQKMLLLKSIAAIEKRIYLEAVRRVRQRIDQPLKNSPDKKISVSEMPNEVHDLVALASIATCLGDIVRIPAIPPGYISDFDRATFSLAPSAGSSPVPGRYEFRLWSAPPPGVKGTMGVVTGELGGIYFPEPEYQ
jgi:hypothetical protein